MGAASKAVAARLALAASCRIRGSKDLGKQWMGGGWLNRDEKQMKPIALTRI
jgi:hypothetical protein